ncbi:branched-chain amino acid ABC transporter permease [Peloplasma aerotolerans]|uniref:Branched-chain amino acid ABC transporter permease n=1 Tax=Peloplasma aerotolerans TaxID=3044389 RepID=A0AAW6U8I5_9MOLU|nr:branched-chain amino acid ABC transporter permease [Mariniplasma sp. M4Ah]MDI6452004.1 branched-chain amino acid ABC transporter permease [Mariniplasma sp. M4Ah]
MILEKYKTSKENKIHQKIVQFTKHPFFGIFIAALLMILVQVLGTAGLIRPSAVDILANMWIYMIVGLGFTLLLGYAGLASLGTAGFIGVGSYVVAFSLGKLGLPLLVAFIMGIVIAIILGTIVGFISLRIEGMYLAIITLGLSEVLVEFFKFATPITNGLLGFQIDRFSIFGILFREHMVYYILVLFLILTMIAVVNLVNSPTGRAMLSIKNSTSAAQAMGISVLKYRLLTFVIATVLAVIGGMLYMSYSRSTIPNLWNLALSLNILAAIVIGGSKSIWGVGLGTFIIFGFDQLVLKSIPFFQTYGNASYIINGVLIILVVMYYPGGLIRLFKDLSGYAKRLYNKLATSWKEYRYGKN